MFIEQINLGPEQLTVDEIKLLAKDHDIYIVYNCYSQSKSNSIRLGQDENYFGDFYHSWRIKPFFERIERLDDDEIEVFIQRHLIHDQNCGLVRVHIF